MNEIRFYKKFLKYLELLLQRLDVDKMKDDARKIGITIGGAGFLGGILDQYNNFEAVFLVLTGVIVWLIGLHDPEA